MDVTQVVVGKLAGFNMWSYQMSENQLKNLISTDVGNVVSWKTLKVFGSSNMVNGSFRTCRKSINGSFITCRKSIDVPKVRQKVALF